LELPLILERELTSLRPVAGEITDIQVHQREDGRWHVNVRLSWRGTALFHVGHYDKKKLRVYTKVSSKIRHIVLVYNYTGMIILHPNSSVRSSAFF
jgi:hypothetical protein